LILILIVIDYIILDIITGITLGTSLGGVRSEELSIECGKLPLEYLTHWFKVSLEVSLPAEHVLLEPVLQSHVQPAELLSRDHKECLEVSAHSTPPRVVTHR
jgi:hypothetical protein